MISKSLLLLFIIGLGINTKISCQAKLSFDIDKLKTYLQFLNANNAFNGEILIALDSIIIFQESIGFASIENKTPLKNGSKFHIASISKTFTGALIALAQSENKLNINDKVINYIPDLLPKFKDITIEQLLKHSSGIVHNEGIIDYWPIKSKLHMTKEQVIREINVTNLLFAPGTKMLYSSLGYYLLATILEKIYVDSFENILQTKILHKLKMGETGSANTSKIIPQLASGYHLLNDDSLVVAPYRNYSMLQGAGDLYSTTLDLLKWNSSFLSNAIIDIETKENIFNKSFHASQSTGEHYGYGWFIGLGDRLKYHHGGGTWGYSSSNAFYPKEKVSMIILSNISTLPMTSIAENIEKIIFGEEFELPSYQTTPINEVMNLSFYCGTFISNANTQVLTITEKEGKLYAQLSGRPPFEIHPKGKNLFFGKKVEIDFKFEVSDGVAVGIKAEGRGNSYDFKKEHK